MVKKSSGMKIGILTAGGDCPGINAAIRGVGKTAIIKYGMELIGISDGFTGMITKEYHELTEKDLSGILTVEELSWALPGKNHLKAKGKEKRY